MARRQLALKEDARKKREGVRERRATKKKKKKKEEEKEDRKKLARGTFLPRNFPFKTSGDLGLPSNY